MDSTGTGSAAISHYEILRLPHPPISLRKTDIKAAYHRALLRYHPDKSGSGTPPALERDVDSSQSPPSNVYTLESATLRTIDQVTTAYKVLSNPSLKSEYDQSLLLSGFRQPGVAAGRSGDDDQAFRTGLEVLDLDDMAVESVPTKPDSHGEQGTMETWYRGCRCGDEKGFMVSEEDLEEEVEKGEIIIGCRGCSLWAKVVFAVNNDTNG